MNLRPARLLYDRSFHTNGASRHFTWFPWIAALAVCAPVSCAPHALSPTGETGGLKAQPAVGAVDHFPEFLPDPAEPLNRAVWELNKGLLFGLIQPTARGYRRVVPDRARESVSDFTRNITYPGRLVNHLFQGRWQGAGDESLRFLANTTVGIGGLFDPATQWNIPKSEAGFGQTFSHWGWTPNFFVMLPLLGPSDDSHAVGSVGDGVANPLNYGDWVYLSFGTSYNRMSGQSEAAAQFAQAEADPYAGLKYAWTYGGKEEPPDWRTGPERDLPSLHTLEAVLFRPKDPEFLGRGRQMSVRLPSTGRRLKFNCWIQPATAPLVYVTPGLGSHRVSNMTVALAESLYHQGYSVVTLTGTFHPEFMENASTAALPAYPPVDANDLLVAVSSIDRKLADKYEGRFGKRAFVGLSMSAFQALHLAAREKSADPSLLRFDRYVALNPPVNLQHGVSKIIGYQRATLDWPAEERQQRINNVVHKAAKVIGLPPEQLANPPFDAAESKYLIGMSFALTLRDTIYSSQRRNNMQVLKTPLSRWSRDAVYREILNYSFRDYFLQFVVPYYKEQGIGLEDFEREMDLRTYGNRLRENRNVRVITNRNDFLLNGSDLSWLRSTLGPSRLTVFPDGGHLGSIGSPQVQNQLIKALDGLK